MRRVSLSTVLMVLVLFSGLISVSGCSDQMAELNRQNLAQADQIRTLTAQLDETKRDLKTCNDQLEVARKTGNIDTDALQQRISALQEDLAKKEQLIKTMQEQLLGGSILPVEIGSALEDLAKQNPDLIEFDSERGLVKFKSDVLFEKGSADVTSSAQQVIRALAGILNSDEAKQFDIIVAGHTDDMPIQRAATKAQHKTNRYLSSHRAISVVELMEQSGIDPKRLSTRGFGEYRPVEDNLPNKGGNPKNRRVEVYVIPKGA